MALSARADTSATADVLAHSLQQIWARRGLSAWALRPLAALYGILHSLNRAAYRFGLCYVAHLDVPVLVVGNLVVGGGGKTPVVMALARALQCQGFRPGLVSRGYGRQSKDCREVHTSDAPRDVGDEALLLRLRTQLPVFVARRRADAARQLLRCYPDCDVIISDDGLQHFALHHDLAVCVFDDRLAGNGWLLPAGPLRERSTQVDWVLHTRRPSAALPVKIRVASHPISRHLANRVVRRDGTTRPLADFVGQPAAALAGIARPSAFFDMLRQSGIDLTHTISLPDHYNFDRWKPLLDMPKLLFCTEKDAQKLWPIAPQAWAVPLEADLPPLFVREVIGQLRQLPRGPRVSQGTVPGST